MGPRVCLFVSASKWTCREQCGHHLNERHAKEVSAPVRLPSSLSLTTSTMPNVDCLDDSLYASGGKGSMRYLFLHGGHSQLPLGDNVSVEAKVLVQNTLGEM